MDKLIKVIIAKNLDKSIAEIEKVNRVNKPNIKIVTRNLYIKIWQPVKNVKIMHKNNP